MHLNQEDKKMNIKGSLSELKKDMLFFLDRQKISIDDIEPMRQESTAKKIAPVAVLGVRNSPRMKYRR